MQFTCFRGATFPNVPESRKRHENSKSCKNRCRKLFQNAPNPVIDNTSISFYLPEDANVRLTVSNTLGQEIMTLSDSSFTKGMHTVDMDATSLSTGVYFYKLEVNKTTLTKQLSLVK